MKHTEGLLGSWTEHTQHGDGRGDFTEALKLNWVEEPFVQVNISRSVKDALRGMHWHRLQWDYWYVADGVAEVHLAQKDHNDELLVEGKTLSPGQGVIVPPRVAHGFLALTDLVLVYGVSKFYNLHTPDEQGFYPFHEKIKWSITPAEAIMSQRDLKAERW